MATSGDHRESDTTVADDTTVTKERGKSMHLKNKVTVVINAGLGIGRATAILWSANIRAEVV